MEVTGKWLLPFAHALNKHQKMLRSLWSENNALRLTVFPISSIQSNVVGGHRMGNGVSMRGIDSEEY
jgi:hypothetical protein